VRLLKAAVIAAGVAIACVVPPIVHFVSGPLGPAIGGFVAGVRLQCEFNLAVVLGALEAVVFTVSGTLIALAATVLTPGLLPTVNWYVAAIGAVVIFLYVFWLGTLGAWAGGAMARRSRAEKEAR
jgi:hypothetical protein